MRKILYISDVIPDPLGTGSEQRSFSLLAAYAKTSSVELWCHPRADHPNARRLNKLYELTTEIFVFYPHIFKVSPVIMSHLLSSMRLADVVHMFKFPFRVIHPNVVWDIDELPTEFRDSHSFNSGETGSAQSETINRWTEFAKLCRLIVASSPLESHQLLPPIRVVPNAYYFRPTNDKRRDSTTILFVGHLGYWPNVEGVTHFYENVFKSLPERFTFRIVGRRPTNPKFRDALGRLAASPRVTIHYDVISCSPYYEDAAVAVVPLLNGSGTRLKILEAFAHRVPVVTTSKGCEGLNLTNNREIIVADEPEEFARACEAISQNSDRAHHLTDNAYEFLERNNSQRAVEKSLYSALDESFPDLFQNK